MGSRQTKRGYVQLERSILYDKRLKPQEKLLYVHMRRYVTFFESNATTSELLGYSERSVQLYKQKLIDLGFVEVLGIRNRVPVYRAVDKYDTKPEVPNDLAEQAVVPKKSANVAADTVTKVVEILGGRATGVKVDRMVGRLKKFSSEDIIDAASRLAANDWWQGRAPKNEYKNNTPTKVGTVDWLLRSDDNVERALSLEKTAKSWDDGVDWWGEGFNDK